jgi:hypothetical protein
MKFTASPPKLVSLYFDCMSAPVWRMVAMTLSSEMRWRPSPCSASDAAAHRQTAERRDVCDEARTTKEPPEDGSLCCCP